MKILILTLIFGGFLLKNSFALKCMMCEIEDDPSQTCDYETCPKSAEYCETLISKVNGNYSIILSCATKDKCSGKFVEDGLEDCKHSKTNTECYTCCNDEDNCNSLDLALESLPKDIFNKKSSKKESILKTLKKIVKAGDDGEVKKPETNKKNNSKKTRIDDSLEEIDLELVDYENNEKVAVKDTKEKAKDEEILENNRLIFNEIDLTKKDKNVTEKKKPSDKDVTLSDIDNDFNADQNSFDIAPKINIESETVKNSSDADKFNYKIITEEESDSGIGNFTEISTNNTESNKTKTSKSNASKTFNSLIVIISSILILSYFL